MTLPEMHDTKAFTRGLHRAAATLIAVFAVMSPGCDCEAESLSEVRCDFDVEGQDGPALLAFPQTEVGRERSRALRLRNTGNRTLENFAFSWDDVNADNYRVVVPEPLRLEVGDEATLTVLFAPLAESTNLGASFVVSHALVSGAGCPSHRVQVDGSAFASLVSVDGGPAADAGDDEDAGDGPNDGGVNVDVDAGIVTPPEGGVALASGSRFVARGALQWARSGFASVALSDGTVLVIGGYGEDGQALDTIERFDPSRGESRVVGQLATPRAEPGAVLLPVDGRVVIAGGRSAAVGGVALRSVEVFDPEEETVACPGTQGGCGLVDNESGLLPVGRINPLLIAFAPAASPEVGVLVGRTLVPDGSDEVPATGGVLLRLGAVPEALELPGAAGFSPRTGEYRARREGDGAVVVGGGRGAAGDALRDLAVLAPPTMALQVVNPGGAMLAPRDQGAAALLSTGVVVLAGGIDGAGQGVGTVDLVTDVFGEVPNTETAGRQAPDLTLETRLGASLLTLTDDLLLLAGGLPGNPGAVPVGAAMVPRADAELLVPFGANRFLRFSPDNDLATPRWQHAAHVLQVPGASAGEPSAEVVVFLGGTETAPRRVPHPAAERFVVRDNAFELWGLLGPGSACTANAPAPVYALGGIDPHTRSISARVRSYDSVDKVFRDEFPLDEPRQDHSVVLLADNNTFLIVGGRDQGGQVLASAVLYNPFLGLVEPLPVGLHRARARATATLLPDGDALLCGGAGPGGEALDTCEVFQPPPALLDPNTYDDARFHLVSGRLSAGRLSHSATLLPDTSEVLLVGGGDVENDLVSADLYVIEQGELRPTGLPTRARRDHIAVHLGTGRVLLAGGEVFAGGLAPAGDAEVYVRAAESFLVVDDEMTRPRLGALGLLLDDGSVLITGGTRLGEGDFPTRSLSLSELYVPGPTGVGSFADLPNTPLRYGRSDVQFGEVFGRGTIVGGNHRGGALTSGDELRTPLFFVEELVGPEEEGG